MPKPELIIYVVASIFIVNYAVKTKYQNNFDAYKACDLVKEKGGKVIREAGPMKHGTIVIAFVEDPDGYKIEFIQEGTIKYPR